MRRLKYALIRWLHNDITEFIWPWVEAQIQEAYERGINAGMKLGKTRGRFGLGREVE